MLLFLLGCTPLMGRLDLASPAVVSQLQPIDVDGDVRFAVLGDFGVHDEGTLPRRAGEILDRLDQACPDCDFVLLPGDNLYPNGVPRNGDTRFLDALADRVVPPLVVVLGNHDWGAFVWPFGGANKKRAARELAWVESRDDVVGDTHFWSLDAGPARLVAVDSTYLVRRCSKAGRCRGQDAIAALSALSDAERWTVLAAHHPLKSDGHHGDAGHYVDFGPFSLGRGKGYAHIVEALPFDLMVSGHDHHLQLIQESERSLLIASSGAKHYDVHDADRSVFLSEEPGFALVEITAATLRVEMHTAEACFASERSRTAPPAEVPCRP